MPRAVSLRQRVRNRLDAKPGIDSESLRRHKDGTFSVRQPFFYRMGKSEATLAAKLLTVLPEAKVVAKDEHWHAWPKQSYWQVRFSVPDDLADAVPEKEANEANEA